jgi:hypothetical protein
MLITVKHLYWITSEENVILGIWRITQHIGGAYGVTLDSGQENCILDTPGQAFTPCVLVVHKLPILQLL